MTNQGVSTIFSKERSTGTGNKDKTDITNWSDNLKGQKEMKIYLMKMTSYNGNCKIVVIRW
jgi:hypothetical protein